MHRNLLRIKDHNGLGIPTSKLVAFLCLLLLFVSATVSSQSASPLENVINIEKLYIDEAENLIKLSFSHDNDNLLAQLESGQAKLQVNIKEGNEVYRDVLFKLQKPIAGNTVVLVIQPPLKASIYKTRSREFELQWVTGNGNIKTSKKAVLGSALYSFDLRPYRKTSLTQVYTKPAMVVFILSLILMLIVPILQKYRFKKNHIKKYIAFENEDQLEDPFTFVTIGEQDQVVELEERNMLLTSWKRIKKLPESKPAQEFSDFFKIYSKGSFFKPTGKKLMGANRAWYGLMGIFIGWIFFVTLNALSSGFFAKLFTILDGPQVQVSTLIARDTLMGLVLGLSYGFLTLLSDELNGKARFLSWSAIGKAFLRSAMISFAFFLQAMVTGYLVHNPFAAGFVSWLLIGIAFAIPLDFKSNLRKRIFFGMLIGLGCFLIAQLLNLGYFIDLFGVYTPTFLTLGLMGSLSAFIGQVEIDKYLRLGAIPSTLHEKIKERPVAKSYLDGLEATGAKLKKAFKKQRAQEIDADYEEVG